MVWRLDRLGRSAKGLTELFEDLLRRGVVLVSLKEGLDLSTSAGLLLAHVLVSVAMLEAEVRSERVVAGQAARATGLSRPTIDRVLGTEEWSAIRPRKRPKANPRMRHAGSAR